MAKSKKQTSVRKAIIAFAVLVAIFVYASAFLFDLQLVQGEELKNKTTNQSLSTTVLTPNRGTIYDATGTKILAQSASVWTIALEPSYFGDDDDMRRLVSTGLAPILEMEAEDIYDKTKENNSFTFLKRKVENDVGEEIIRFMEENNIGGGIRILEDYKRYYPYGTLASSVIGFTGTDGNGLYGIEMQYEDELSGTAGKLVNAKNATGTDMPFQYEQMVSAEDGYDLILTIDETVQSICEKYLADGIEKYDVKNSGAAIVMNVNTGAIIALATGEQFDLNDPWTLVNEETQATIDALPENERDSAYSDALYKQWRNKAVSDTYEPGSVFKDVTAAAALESGSINIETTFSCHGVYTPTNSVQSIRCWVSRYGYNHGVQTVVEGLCNSCNPFFMQTAEAMGSQTFYNYYESFGFTEKTGVDLPGEAIGSYHSLEELNPVELATASFGQGITVTPIQMITAVAAIANGGYLVQPHVVSKVLDNEGNIIEIAEEESKRQVISEETAKTVTDILEQNATTGSGKSGYVEGYRIAGKTGTSEKVAKYLENPDLGMDFIASYAGFAPADNPEYALLLFFDEPDRETASGGGQAGPVFANIMKEILPYLGVQSSITEEEFNETRAIAPGLVGMTVAEAENMAAASGLTAEVFGDADDNLIVSMQVPSEGSEMPKGGKIVLYTDESVQAEQLVVVPDFTGLTVSECNAVAADNNIQIILTGAKTSGDIKAQGQNIFAGEKVKPGTVITITLVDYSGIE